MVAVQDQALATRYRSVKICNIPSITKCRLCGRYDETIDYVVSGYPELAKQEYTTRHEKVCAQVHFEVCRKLNIQVEAKKWYVHFSSLTNNTLHSACGFHAAGWLASSNRPS